jgi:hypothetical protein
VNPHATAVNLFPRIRAAVDTYFMFQSLRSISKMFTAYVRTKSGKIALCALPTKRRDAEETAANMSKAPDVERVSLAAYGRIIAAFKGGLQTDLDAP